MPSLVIVKEARCGEEDVPAGKQEKGLFGKGKKGTKMLSRE